jgi:hypothetical protein
MAMRHGPEFWRARAREMREDAATVAERKTAQLMLDIAGSYEKLADALAEKAVRAFSRDRTDSAARSL